MTPSCQKMSTPAPGSEHRSGTGPAAGFGAVIDSSAARYTGRVCSQVNAAQCGRPGARSQATVVELARVRTRCDVTTRPPRMLGSSQRSERKAE